MRRWSSLFPLCCMGAFEECRDWYRNNGCTRALHGAFIDVNPASGDPVFREHSRRRCRECCELALALDVKYVVFHSSAFPFLRGAYLSHWAGVCAEFYMELADEYGLISVLGDNGYDGKRLNVSKYFIQQREAMEQKISTEEGVLLRVNRSIQAEGVLP